jgi:hypothetical protein
MTNRSIIPDTEEVTGSNDLSRGICRSGLRLPVGLITLLGYYEMVGGAVVGGAVVGGAVVGGAVVGGEVVGGAVGGAVAPEGAGTPGTVRGPDGGVVSSRLIGLMD